MKKNRVNLWLGILSILLGIILNITFGVLGMGKLSGMMLGGFFGLALVLLIFYRRESFRTIFGYKGKFDEYQLQLRGKIFFHITGILIFLLMFNALLASSGLIWSSIFAQNMLFVMFAVTLGSIEMILKGAYIDQIRYANKIPVFLLIISLIAIILNFIPKFDTVFIKNGLLTDDAAMLITMFFLATVGLIGIIKAQIDKRQVDEK